MHAARTANISQVDGRKQRRPLRKPAVCTLKSSTEEMEERGEEIYPRKRTGYLMAAMEKLWYFTQGNVTAHLKKKQILKTQVQELHETGGTLTGWEEFSFGISALFSLILARVEQTLKWVWIKSGLTDRKPFSYTKSNTWLCNFLTIPAVPLGHFAHPGLGDGGTGYCVLGWFLYNVPRSGLQTPLKATGFVSPGAGSPFAPLTHLAALCRERQKKVMCRETTALLGVNTDTLGSRLMQAEGAFTWMP